MLTKCLGMLMLLMAWFKSYFSEFKDLSKERIFYLRLTSGLLTLGYKVLLSLRKLWTFEDRRGDEGLTIHFVLFY
jgi:hypothetical protein